MIFVLLRAKKSSKKCHYCREINVINVLYWDPLWCKFFFGCFICWSCTNLIIDSDQVMSQTSNVVDQRTDICILEIAENSRSSGLFFIASAHLHEIYVQHCFYATVHVWFLIFFPFCGTRLWDEDVRFGPAESQINVSERARHIPT